MAGNDVAMKTKVDPAVHLVQPKRGSDASSDDSAESQQAKSGVAIGLKMIPFAYVDHDQLPEGVGVNGPGATVGFEYLPMKGITAGFGVQASFIPLGGSQTVYKAADPCDMVAVDCTSIPDGASSYSTNKLGWSGLAWNFAAISKLMAPIGEYFHVSGGAGLGGAHLYLDGSSEVDSFSFAMLVNAEIGVGNESVQAIAGMNLMVGGLSKKNYTLAAYPGIGGRISF